ncbi:MAG: tetratricopeptide repeat protein [Planctomycetota bacterium]|jgi:predicted  nucleic acid-binding Zn-ribbon protein
MTNDKIENLLQQADRMAGGPARVGVDVSIIRRRANRRRLAISACPVAAAAVLVVALGVWSLGVKQPLPTDEQRKIASLETQIRQLQASTDAAVALIHEVLENERRQSWLDELEAELASISDPLEEIRKQVDTTAFILVYQADRLYRELNETESAVQTYNRVIRLFPANQWAEVARQRLSEIEKTRYLREQIYKEI